MIATIVASFAPDFGSTSREVKSTTIFFLSLAGGPDNAAD